VADPTLDEAEHDPMEALFRSLLRDRKPAALDRALSDLIPRVRALRAALVEAQAEIERLRAAVPTTDDVARAIHVAMHHPDCDPEQPCRIEYPGGFTFCDGPRVRDRDAADAVRALAAAPAPPVNRSEWTSPHTWRDPDCIECGGEGAPCCEPPDTPAPAEDPRCRYCGADCSDGRSWDGGDIYACPACADRRAGEARARAMFLKQYPEGDWLGLRRDVQDSWRRQAGDES
jgi:hypothetical protein